MSKIDPDCVKETRRERIDRALTYDRIITTAVLGWSCWLITRVADQLFSDPAGITLHAVNAFALVVGGLATAYAGWKWLRSKVQK